MLTRAQNAPHNPKVVGSTTGTMATFSTAKNDENDRAGARKTVP